LTEYSNIKISEYSYLLPDHRIAKYPLPERDSSKLLIWKQGKIAEDTFRYIAGHIPQGSKLIFNNTRVIHARMFFRKESGAKIEVFCLEPIEPADHQLSFQQAHRVVWRCMVGNAKRWKNETLSRTILAGSQSVLLEVKKITKEKNTFLIEFTWTAKVSFAELIEAAGTLPIPPYLNREPVPADEDTYQTIFAKNDGSVAAPTAGLHFTDAVLSDLKHRNITTGEVTLHVGAGTFTPVKSETIAGHTMHHETIVVSRNLIEELITSNQRIIAVGTTSVRSLESLFWLGQKINNPALVTNHLEVKQWEPYKVTSQYNKQKALQNIIDYLNTNNLDTLHFSTQIIIVPGYNFRITEGIITNFHQPQSTLILLISAFLGSGWKKVYDYALENNFRFLSYGDSNLYLK